MDQRKTIKTGKQSVARNKDLCLKTLKHVLNSNEYEWQQLTKPPSNILALSSSLEQEKCSKRTYKLSEEDPLQPAHTRKKKTKERNVNVIAS